MDAKIASFIPKLDAKFARSIISDWTKSPPVNGLIVNTVS